MMYTMQSMQKLQTYIYPLQKTAKMHGGRAADMIESRTGGKMEDEDAYLLEKRDIRCPGACFFVRRVSCCPVISSGSSAAR